MNDWRVTRRRFLLTSVATALAVPRVLEAQPPGRVSRVGLLYFGSRHTGAGGERYTAFLEGMRALGYVEGTNLLVEARFADSEPGRVPDLAKELLRSKVEIIVATGSPVYRVLQRMTTIPSSSRSPPILFSVAWPRASRGPAATSPACPTPPLISASNSSRCSKESCRSCPGWVCS